MLPITIPNRPFSSDLMTGLMLPDGIFEASIGKQTLNAHFKNSSSAALNSIKIYFESSSNPNIIINPNTFTGISLSGGAVLLKSWVIDVSNVPVGSHYVSFIAENALGRQRIIKKIFVTKVTYNSSTHSFSAECPEGSITVKIDSIIKPNTSVCYKKTDKQKGNIGIQKLFSNLNGLFENKERTEFCPIVILPTKFRTTIKPNPSFSGQYGDLPFNDPWWKVLFAIIAALLALAASIAEAIDGTGDLTVGGLDCTIDPTTGLSVCSPSAVSGSGTSPIAAGLLAAAAAVATIAVASDERDIHRKGEDNTKPNHSDEVTVQETLNGRIKYIESIGLGKPFAINIDYDFERVTVDSSSNTNIYTHSANETFQNVHYLKEYKVHAPNVISAFKKEPFLITAEFIDKNGKILRGDQLFVQCFLFGPNNKIITIPMLDSGVYPDKDANNGTYSGIYYFNYFNKDEAGIWKYIVIAQDINFAKEDMKAEDAAKIIGGMVLTNQLTIDLSGGTCPYIEDGHVNVTT